MGLARIENPHRLKDKSTNTKKGRLKKGSVRPSTDRGGEEDTRIELEKRREAALARGHPLKKGVSVEEGIIEGSAGKKCQIVRLLIEGFAAGKKSVWMKESRKRYLSTKTTY